MKKDIAWRIVFSEWIWYLRTWIILALSTVPISFWTINNFQPSTERKKKVEKNKHTKDVNVLLYNSMFRFSITKYVGPLNRFLKRWQKLFWYILLVTC